MMKYIFTCILFTIGFMLCNAQKNIDFKTFIQSLEKASIARRSPLVNKYLSEQKSTPIIDGKEKVHFVWFGKADTLRIEGELQKSWSTPAVMTKIDCGEQDFFYTSAGVASNALLEYRFMADGRRIVDLRNPRIAQGFDFSDRNIFTMPDFVESPDLKIRYDIDKGTVNQWVFKTKHPVFTDQPIAIYTPYNYSKSKIYPVLYVYDGIPSLNTRPFINVINNLIYDGKIEPIVAVFIGPENRWNEYVEQSAEYGKWISDEVVPFIEKNFNTSTDPTKRGVIGASASGHGAMVTALRNSEIFGNVASQGGGAGGTPGLNQLANQALDIYLTKKDQFPLRNIYSEVGNYDLEFPDEKIIFRDGVRQFHQRLKESSIDHVYKEVNSGHNVTIWNQSIAEILILFYGK